MAHKLQGKTIPGLLAEADYSAAQHRFVKINANGNAELAGAGDDFDGVMENNPKAGQSATVHSGGTAKVEASAAIAVGAKVSAAANGKARTAVSGDRIAGVCVSAAAADGDICSVAMGAQEGGTLP